ncbi:MAG: Nif3-like dinuclear metal center hexameric protein [Candidatus Symbiodolus clandestinus]
MQLQELIRELNDTLQPNDIQDACPNGLQVEGRSEIQKILTGVTACQALLEVAVEQQVDAILVHHGYGWRQQSLTIIGMQRQRLKTLLMHDISLIAYHLPLDIHPQLGNNAQLAEILGIQEASPVSQCQPLGIVWQGELASPLSGIALAERIQHRLLRQPLHCDAKQVPLIQSLAWCTGAGQSYITQAAALGVDAFITGEVSEPTIHIAREMGLHFYAVGHHASERYGIKALGEWLKQQHNLSVQFVDIDNPA